MPSKSRSEPLRRRKILRDLGRLCVGVGVVNGGTAQQLLPTQSRKVGGTTRQQTEWDRSFDHSIDLIPDTEANGGGSVVTYEDSISKFDRAGDERWKRTYEGLRRGVIPVSEANNGGYLIPLNDRLIRLAPDGTNQWTRSYEDPVQGGILSAAEANADGFFFGGGYYYPDRETYSNWIVRIDDAGDEVWEITESLTGSHPDTTQSVREIFGSGGGGCVAFVWNKYLGATDSSYQTLIGIGEDGTEEWEVELPGDRYVPEARQTRAGNYLVRTGISGPNSKLTAVSGDGVELWVKELGATSLPDPIIDVGDGFVFVDSQSTRSFRLRKVGPDGGERWTRTYDTRRGNSVTGIELGSPDGYLLAGSGGDTVYEHDAWIMRVDANREKAWEQVLDFSEGVDYIYKTGEGTYLLGGSNEASWIATRESPILRLPDVTGGGDRPSDPDRDGLYEDVNGDGSLNVGDAQTLYSNRDSGAVQDYVNQYDFNDDGVVNVGDAQTLFSEALEDG